MSTALFYSLGGGILVLLFLLELRSPSFRRDAFADRLRAVRNWSYLISNVVALFFIGVAAHFIPQAVPTLVSMHSFGALDFVGCLLVGELYNYGLHYGMHWSSLLWRFHYPHHRETNYNLWLASHLHCLESFASACCMSTIFTLLGFSVLAKQIYFLYFIFVTTYHHSANHYTLGPLDWLIISPAYHRLHHVMKIRGNYGSTLTLLDVLFGTAVWPNREKHAGLPYGITSKQEPYGFWTEFRYGFRRSPRPTGLEVTES